MLGRGLLLLLLTLLVCVPQWSFPEWHGSEGQRVTIALEMARTGDWLVPRFGGEPVWTKPPLHYWLLAILIEVGASDRVWMRLPGVLSLWLAAWTAHELLRRHFSSAAGWAAALGVVCSPVVLFEFPSAEIDPVFASTTAMALWVLATGVARDRPGLVAVSGLLGGCALLAKGPAFFVYAAGAYLVWWRRRGGRHAVAHFVLLLLPPLLYYLGLWAGRGDPGLALAAVQSETSQRIFHEIGSWEWLVTMPGFFLRAAAVQMPMVLWCFWEWRGARDARMDAADLTLRMCSGAAVLAVALLAIGYGRPTRYLLPNVLLFTFAVAPAVAHFAAQRRALGVFSTRVVAVLGVFASVAAVALPFLMPRAVGALGLAVAVGLALSWIATPRSLVVAAWALPVLGAWTVGLDRAAAWPESATSLGLPAQVLQRELRHHGCAAVATRGFVDEKLLLEAAVPFQRDRAGQSEPRLDWLLQSAALPVPEDHAVVAHLSFRQPLVLAKRRGGR